VQVDTQTVRDIYVDPEFPRFWNYVDPNGISSRVDLTAIFNPEAVGRLTIADTQGDILAAGGAKRLGARGVRFSPDAFSGAFHVG
jgi:hypothetical protein